MTPDQVRASANQQIAASGRPNVDNGQYWVDAWNQWGSGDPAYFQTRLQQGLAGNPAGPKPLVSPFTPPPIGGGYSALSLPSLTANVAAGTANSAPQQSAINSLLQPGVE